MAIRTLRKIVRTGGLRPTTFNPGLLTAAIAPPVDNLPWFRRRQADPAPADDLPPVRQLDWLPGPAFSVIQPVPWLRRPAIAVDDLAIDTPPRRWFPHAGEGSPVWALPRRSQPDSPPADDLPARSRAWLPGPQFSVINPTPWIRRQPAFVDELLEQPGRRLNPATFTTVVAAPADNLPWLHRFQSQILPDDALDLRRPNAALFVTSTQLAVVYLPWLRKASPIVTEVESPQRPSTWWVVLSVQVPPPPPLTAQVCTFSFAAPDRGGSFAVPDRQGTFAAPDRGGSFTVSPGPLW